MSNDSWPESGLSFETRVSAAIGRLPRGSVLLAAVSGGADSCSMLAALARLRDQSSFTLHCAHVVHGIRPEEQGEAEASLVKALCARLAVPCIILEIPRGAIRKRARGSGRGIEDAARFYRHRALKAEADRLGADRILFAHTENDLLETAVMRFLRGSGPAGLAAMPVENGRILRPLLSLSRDDVLDYLSALRIPYAEDPSNSDPRYLRNRIRSRLMPLLDADFPGWRTAVRSLAESQSEVARFISEEARSKVVWHPCAQRPDSLEVDVQAFFAVDPVVRSEALYQGADAVTAVLKKNGMTPSSDPPISKEREPARDAVSLFIAGTVKAQNLGLVRAVRSAKSVIVEKACRGPSESGFCIVVTKAGTYPCAGTTIIVCERGVVSDIQLSLPFVVRSARRSEHSKLRSKFPAFRTGSAIRFLAEDRHGGVVLALEGQNGAPELLHELGKRRVTDYADSVFFSIL